MTTQTTEELKPLFELGLKTCYACANELTGDVKTCYACANDLTGEPKYDYGDDYEEWECYCDEWDCRCEESMMCYCPICHHRFAESDYLASVFDDDEKARWLANMVTHYRHEHRAWDRSHRYISWKYGQDTYERQKSIINEQAKRQIVRKATEFLLAHGIGVETFAKLQGTEEKTIELATKKLL